MLNIDYEQGLDTLEMLIKRQKPEILLEFSNYQVRLMQTVEREKFGHGSDNSFVRNEVLDQLIRFTNEHFSLQFIDLCRPETVLDHSVEKQAPAPTNDLSAVLWQSGNEITMQETKYLLHEPIEVIWAPDRSALLQQAQAQELGAKRMVLLKQVQVRRATPDAETWKSALEKEARLLDALEQKQGMYQSFPRRLASVPSTPYAATLVQSLLLGRSWQQEYGLHDAPLSTQTTRSLLRSAITLCDGLRVLHAHNVAHRALSPEKIFLLNGRSVFQDVGLAGWKYRPGEGPALYRAPEQAISNRTSMVPGGYTDVYQLGMILYHLITGGEPQPDQLLSLQVWNPELPRELDAIVQRALAFNRRERWSSIADFSSALKRVTR